MGSRCKIRDEQGAYGEYEYTGVSALQLHWGIE